nr:Putative transposase InsQ for insertion sequence element IS609 [Klebsiella pneumoniae]
MRQLARKVKFSANWKKQKARTPRLHSHIASIRRDYLHKVTTTVSKNHAMIVIEDLKGFSSMSKSAAGTVDEPGRNVAAKSGLNRAILDQAGTKCAAARYKQRWRGGKCRP